MSAVSSPPFTSAQLIRAANSGNKIWRTSLIRWTSCRVPNQGPGFSRECGRSPCARGHGVCHRRIVEQGLVLLPSHPKPSCSAAHGTELFVAREGHPRVAVGQVERVVALREVGPGAAEGDV